MLEDDPFLPWPRRGLREIVALRVALDSLESELVVMARAQGHTWAALGDDVGLTPAGVRKRHLAVDPIQPRRPPRRHPTLEEMLASLAAHRR